MSDIERATATLSESNLVVTAPDGVTYKYWAGSCGEPGCDCQDIVLYPVDGENPPASGLDDVDELRIDPHSAVIMDEDGSPLETDQPRYLALLADSLTGDVLEALVRRWHDDKGVAVELGRRAKPIGLEDWSIDDPVAWEQVFQTIRVDDYVIDGITYTAMELFSANPADPDSEIYVDFAESTDDDDDDDDDDDESGDEDDDEDDEIPIGMVTLRLNGGATLEPEEGEDETLAALWKLYKKRHPTMDRLRKRQAEMKRVGGELLMALNKRQ